MRVGQGVRTGLGHGGIICVLQTLFSSFYAPNFGEVEGAYWFGLSVRPSVRQSVCPSVRNSLAAEKLKNR